MNKTVLLTEPVVADINFEEKFPEFIQRDNITNDSELVKCKRLYTSLASKNTNDLEILARLEELIIQLRCKHNIDMKLSVVSGYIYARTNFYRRNKKLKDIRVIVCKDNAFKYIHLNDLIAHPRFVLLAAKKLKEAMSKHIDENMSYLTEQLNKISVEAEINQ